MSHLSRRHEISGKSLHRRYLRPRQHPRWLDGGNNTCPAAMQILHNKDFTPNRTLQRLIEIWSDSVHRRACAESAAPTRNEIADAIDRVKIEKEERYDREILSNILRFARESGDNRAFLAGKDDFVRLLVDLIDFSKLSPPLNYWLFSNQNLGPETVFESDFKTRSKTFNGNRLFVSNRECRIENRLRRFT